MLDGVPDWDEVSRLVRQAYHRVATPRQRALLAGAPAARGSRPEPRALADLDGLGPAMLGARQARTAVRTRQGEAARARAPGAQREPRRTGR